MENDNAHYTGFNDGIENHDNMYPIPINDYQREYNRGYKAGLFMSKENTAN